MAKIVFPTRHHEIISLDDALDGWYQCNGIIVLHCIEDSYGDAVFLLNEAKNGKYNFRMMKRQSGIGGFSDTPEDCCEYYAKFSSRTLYYFECLQEFIKWLSTLPKNTRW